MYVAITRARKRLYLSFSQTRMLHGQTRYNMKSRFFDELPEDALNWLTPRNQGFGSGFQRDYQAAWARGSGPGLDRRRRARRAGRAAGAGAEGAVSTACARAERVPQQVRRRRHRHARRQRRRRPRASQFRPPRHEVAGVERSPS